MNKTLIKYLNIIITVILLLLALFFISLKALGFTPYSIVSSSMSPAYKQGDVVYTKNIEFNDLKVGDTVAFVANEEKLIVTHRVIDIDEDEEIIYTKGDNNKQADSTPVSFKSVRGIVIFKIPYLGYVTSFLTKGIGKYLYLGVIFILLIMLFWPLNSERKTFNGK